MTPAITVPARSRSLTDAEYAALAGFLAREAGLVFDESRRAALSGIVADRIAEFGAADLGAYLARISGAGNETSTDFEGGEERQRLLDEVTIPETHFFRNPPQMQALRKRLLPELMRRAAGRGRPLIVWSAGCSSGEEPYSIAMLAEEVAGELTAVPEVRITATDISSQAIAATSRARYSGRSLSYADADQLARWFQPLPDGGHEVIPRVRRHVETKLHNLVTLQPPFELGTVDLIVCRNVTIYFSRDTMRALVAKFHAALAPGGYLVLGHAETLWKVTDAFTLVTLGDAFVYRKDVPAALAVEPEGAAASIVITPLPATRARVARRPLHVVAAGTSEPRDAIPDPDAASALLADARIAMDQARYAEAARLAARAAVASPFEVDAYVVEGRARSTVGDDRGALVALRKAVYLSPKAGHARFMLAGSLTRCDEHAAAAREYRAAAQTLPGTPKSDLLDLLDGCDVGELVVLCRRLADECERRAAG